MAVVRRTTGHGSRIRGGASVGRLCLAILSALTVGLGLLQFAAAAPAVPRGGRPGCPWLGSKLPLAERVAMVMRRITPAEEITLVEGHGVDNPYVFYVPAIPRLCLPAIGMEDGPSGVGDKLTGVTELPAAVALAATWDRRLARRYGEVIGAEDRGKGVSVALAPTVNIDRDPRWGRLFESLSEDPYLTGEIAGAEIGGIQNQGVIDQVKHLDAYNQETNRNTPADDVIISQRVLHEIYLPAFRTAIRAAKAGSVMCAYSTVNGAPSCENRYLLTDVLRREWDFRGFVTSDYQAVHATAAALDGTDQQQPFSTYFGAPLLAAVQRGSVSRATLNTMVAPVLKELFRFGLIDHPRTVSISATVTTQADVRMASEVAEAGTVLLKNRDGVLPLAAHGAGAIAVIGPGASSFPAYAGGGSAYVIPARPISPLAGIRRAVGNGRKLVYAQGLPTDTSLKPIPASALSVPYGGTGLGGRYAAVLTAPETGTYVLAFRNPCHCYAASVLRLDGRELLSNPGTPPVSTFSASVQLAAGQRYRLTLTGATSGLVWAKPSDLAPYLATAVRAAKQAAVAVVVVADHTETEAADRPDLVLPSAQNELIEAVAAANPRTVVVIDAGAPVVMPWLDRVAAVLDPWYPGETNGAALAAILFGAVDPGGHLPVTFPQTLAQAPAAAPSRFPGVGGKVLYAEGLDVGYRWYDAKRIKPLFPFGFGLSYTHFTFDDLRVSPEEASGTVPVRVTARVANAGKVAGSDVVQLYLGMPQSTGEPPRKLVGFQRVTLAPGQSQSVAFVIRPRASWWWHRGGWDQTAGTYRVYVGDSSALDGLPLRGSFRMTNAVGERRVVVSAPATLRPGEAGTVKVVLTAGGDETLADVRLRLTAPEGWQVEPIGATTQSAVAPPASASASFRVTPPAWAFAENVTLYGSAQLGAELRRGAGATTRVSPQQDPSSAGRHRGRLQGG